jgi:hypothetical protein
MADAFQFVGCTNQQIDGPVGKLIKEFVERIEAIEKPFVRILNDQNIQVAVPSPGAAGEGPNKSARLTRLREKTGAKIFLSFSSSISFF